MQQWCMHACVVSSAACLGLQTCTFLLHMACFLLMAPRSNTFYQTYLLESQSRSGMTALRQTKCSSAVTPEPAAQQMTAGSCQRSPWRHCLMGPATRPPLTNGCVFTTCMTCMPESACMGGSACRSVPVCVRLCEAHCICA